MIEQCFKRTDTRRQPILLFTIMTYESMFTQPTNVYYSPVLRLYDFYGEIET